MARAGWPALRCPGRSGRIVRDHADGLGCRCHAVIRQHRMIRCSRSTPCHCRDCAGCTAPVERPWWSDRRSRRTDVPQSRRNAIDMANSEQDSARCGAAAPQTCPDPGRRCLSMGTGAVLDRGSRHGVRSVLGALSGGFSGLVFQPVDRPGSSDIGQPGHVAEGPAPVSIAPVSTAPVNRSAFEMTVLARTGPGSRRRPPRGGRNPGRNPDRCGGERRLDRAGTGKTCVRVEDETAARTDDSGARPIAGPVAGGVRALEGAHVPITISKGHQMPVARHLTRETLARIPT